MDACLATSTRDRVRVIRKGVKGAHADIAGSLSEGLAALLPGAATAQPARVDLC